MGCCDWCENRHLCGKYDDEKRYCLAELYDPGSGSTYSGFKIDKEAFEQEMGRRRRSMARNEKMNSELYMSQRRQ